MLYSKLYYYLVYSFIGLSFIVTPFLMFGFKTYYLECSNGERIEIENYSIFSNFTEYEELYCNESFTFESYFPESTNPPLSPFPSTNFTASYSTSMH